MVDRQPKAKPQIMLVAAPVVQAYDNSFTGLQVQLVIIQVKQPMMSPATSPRIMHKQASKAYFLTGLLSTERRNMKSPRKISQKKQSPGMRNKVERVSCLLREFSTWWASEISSPSVMRADTIRETMRPIAGIPKTKMIVSNLMYPSSPVTDVPPRMKAAQVDSANEPNKSAPIPAISPTLSPTLSAIVAGFLGLSSGRLLSILPTKSEPKSAAFVNIPPPTRANKATEEPPSPYPATLSKTNQQQFSWLDCPAMLSIILQVRMSAKRISMLTDTNANPITTPDLKAVLKAQPKEVLAQIVVRQLEKVAIFIPKLPQSMLVAAPRRKANVVQKPSYLSTQKNTAEPMKSRKTEHTLYSDAINQLAPSWIRDPIQTTPIAASPCSSCVSSSIPKLLPIGIFFNRSQLKNAQTNPMIPVARIRPSKRNIFKYVYKSFVNHPRIPHLKQSSISKLPSCCRRDE